VLCDGPRECIVAAAEDGPATAFDKVAGGLGAANVVGAGLLAAVDVVADGLATVREIVFDGRGLTDAIPGAAVLVLGDVTVFAGSFFVAVVVAAGAKD